MTTTLWVLVVLAVWVLLALAVALVLGRVVRMRDRQVPDPPEQPDPGRREPDPGPREAGPPEQRGRTGSPGRHPHEP